MRAKRKAVPIAAKPRNTKRRKAKPSKRAHVDIHRYPGLACFGEDAAAIGSAFENDIALTPRRWGATDTRLASVNPMISCGEVARAHRRLFEALARLPNTLEVESARCALSDAVRANATGWIDSAYVDELANRGRRMILDDVHGSALWDITFHGVGEGGVTALMQAIKAQTGRREASSSAKA